MPLRPPNDVQTRTRIYRMVHIDCLRTILARDALHAPSCVPNDGLPYVGIHATQTQADRGNTPVPCGPGGVIRDYVGFYFGPRSPMLYRIHTGYNAQQVDQGLIAYLVAIAQEVAAAGVGFAFTDRHSLAAIATFSDDLAQLSMVDFPVVYAERWNSTAQQPDRQEKKQAEFLVHQQLPWNRVIGIGVLNRPAVHRANDILDAHPNRHRPPVAVRNEWYY